MTSTEASTPKPLRVLVAEDHPATREHIVRVLRADERFDVVSQVDNGASAVQSAIEKNPDICLLDVRMPGSGIAAVWEIAGRVPDAKIVMLTVSDAQEDLFAALQAGAHGYLLKDIELARLPEALWDAYRGRTAMPRALVSRLVDQFRTKEPRWRRVAGEGELGRLTSREWQILELLSRDLSTEEIAAELTLSASAVRAHISSIVKKLGVENRAAAAELFRNPD